MSVKLEQYAGCILFDQAVIDNVDGFSLALGFPVKILDVLSIRELPWDEQSIY